MLAITHLIGFGCGSSSGACACTPAYVTGDRTGLISVTTTLTPLAGSNVTNLVDGGFANNGTDSFAVIAGSEPAAGKIIRFDFGPGARVKITEARWRQQDASSHGAWKWQGWSEDVPWTDLTAAFTLGGSTLQTHSDLGGNMSGYRAYQLFGVSGNFSDTPWIQEVEFKQCSC
jgi:hypothetical protein